MREVPGSIPGSGLLSFFALFFYFYLPYFLCVLRVNCPCLPFSLEYSCHPATHCFPKAKFVDLNRFSIDCLCPLPCKSNILTLYTNVILYGGVGDIDDLDVRKLITSVHISNLDVHREHRYDPITLILVLCFGNDDIGPPLSVMSTADDFGLHTYIGITIGSYRSRRTTTPEVSLRAGCTSFGISIHTFDKYRTWNVITPTSPLRCCAVDYSHSFSVGTRRNMAYYHYQVKGMFV